MLALARALVGEPQLLMLDDPMFVARASSFIRERRINAEWALQQVFDDLSSVLEDYGMDIRTADAQTVSWEARKAAERAAKGVAAEGTTAAASSAGRTTLA